MTAGPPEILANPVGVVVGLITAVESAVDSAVVETVVTGVAGGRAKQRRLAQALSDRPALLIDGRSPAPRVVGDLLIALRQAGAVGVSAPRCAKCDKQLRTLQRRDEDWYCGACGPRRQLCAVCGQNRPVHSRDRAGRPHCARCPQADELDPVAILVEVVTGVDPALDPETVVAAVHAAARTGQVHQLAWALRERPDLLTGAGAHAPVPSVLRLIDQLHAAGARNIVRPACPHCQRVIALPKLREGLRSCRNCVARSRAVPCVRCGVVREPGTRDDYGRPLCPRCLITDPANQETCVGCRRRRPVSVRGPDGPRCPTCRPVPTLTCSICGRSAPCEISAATGQPWCRACRQRWARCAGCGQVRPTRGGTADHPTCATCTRPDPGFWRRCPGCGQPGQLRAGPCPRCTIDQRLRALLADEAGHIRPELQTLHQTLAAAERPNTVARWLDKGHAPAILRELGTGRRPLTHQALDELPAGKPVEHLRAILVAADALPTRDEHMARVERWTVCTIADRADADEQQLLHRYADWHLLRRLRGRTRTTPTSHSQATVVQQHVRAAIALLDWLTGRGLTLATCQQPDLEAWLTSNEATHRREAGHFIRWAKTQKLTTLRFPAARWSGPCGPIDTETRWNQARRLLHDDSLNPADRVAGLLVLLYAQWPATISRLTLAHVHTTGHEVRLRLGREPILLPEPLATLVTELLASRTGHAVLGDQGTSRWLFPGGQPNRPISAEHLTERLRQLGLRAGQARSTALFQLATDLPAAILARMLGIHISVAVTWQRASSGDWTTYAADYSRRTHTSDQPTHGPTE